MIKFTDFKEFLVVVKDLTKEDLIKIKLTLQNEGLDIKSLDELIENENDILFTILPDGTLQRVNLYIAEQIVGEYVNEFTPKYKYHIFKCNTIIEMFNSGRKHRYKINVRNNGTFYFRYIDFYGRILKEKNDEKIYICKNCLKKYFKLIGKKYYYKDSDDYVNNFNLKEFEQKFGTFFNNTDIRDLFQANSYFSSNVYPKKWNIISKKIKIKRDYTCEKCGFKPRNNYEKRFIHVHHINGDKTNNNQDNLKVLCIKCHASVDSYHLRMKASSDYREFENILSAQ